MPKQIELLFGHGDPNKTVKITNNQTIGLTSYIGGVSKEVALAVLVDELLDQEWSTLEINSGL